jgi:hypothetical protein
MIKKGTTEDFSANKDIFHLRDYENEENCKIVVKDLKAVFFVKSFEGDSKYQERFNVERVGLGRKMSVLFKDGEVLEGYTNSFSRERAGFILFLSDSTSNNDKAFVVFAATSAVNFVN